MKISKRESCLQTIIPTCCPKHPLLASQSKSAVVKMSCFVGRLLEEIASRPMVLHHRRRVHCKCTHNIANVSRRNVKVVNMDHAKLYFTILNYTLFVLHCFPCLCTCSWKKNILQVQFKKHLTWLILSKILILIPLIIQCLFLVTFLFLAVLILETVLWLYWHSLGFFEKWDRIKHVGQVAGAAMLARKPSSSCFGRPSDSN